MSNGQPILFWIDPHQEVLHTEGRSEGKIDDVPSLCKEALPFPQLCAALHIRAHDGDLLQHDTGGGPGADSVPNTP